MKIKATRAYIKALYNNVYQCGYGDLQDIMYGENPTYYNCGVYGWNFDCYTNGNIAITTGYRNMTGKKIPKEIINKYSVIAKEIVKKSFKIDYEIIEEELRKNREKFFMELTEI